MKKVLILLSVCGVLSFTGCIDREFDLADVSGEITLGGEELVVPLADIGEIYLGDLLEGNDVISSNENGVYQIAFSSFGDDRSKWEAIGIDGISIPAITGLSPELKPISFELEELPTTMTMAGISESFVAEFPKIDNVNLSINPITKNEDLGSLPNKLKGSLGKLGFSGDTGTITPTILNLLGDNASLSDEFSGSTNFSIEVNDIPEQVSSVNVVEFGNAKNDYGSPFEVKIDLGGMSGIVGGGVLTINVEFPSSYYLCDENGVEFSEGANNKLNKEINLQPGQELVSVIVYLKNIKFENQGNGGIAINDTISYGYDLNFNLQAGDFDLSKLPQFSINAVPECKDIIVTVGNVDKEMKVEDYVCKFERSFEMPEGIKIEKVLFKNTELKLNMSGLQWLSIDGEQVAMNITFPKCMVFANHPLLAKYADGATYLLANATELANGITLQLDAIDCEAKDEGVVFANGELKVNSDIVVKAEVPSVNGKTMSVSSLISTLTPSPDYVTDTDNNGKWNVNVNVSIEGSELQLDTENTVVKWSEERAAVPYWCWE